MQEQFQLMETVCDQFPGERLDLEKSEIGRLYMAYQGYRNDLEKLADCIPGKDNGIASPDELVAVILQKRGGLLDRAATLPVQTQSDVLALLALWHAERVEEQDGVDLSAADRLVRSVCGYFGIV